MLRVLIILLIFITFQCFGNGKDTILVRKIINLEQENVELNKHINYLTYKLDSLSMEYTKFTYKSDANDTSFWEYGGSLVGIIMALIILFGFIFNFTSTNAANKIFMTNFGYYTDRFRELEKKCTDLYDIQSLNVNSLSDVTENKDESENKIDEEFKD